MAGVLKHASELVHQRTGARTAVRVDWSPGVIFTKAARSVLAEKLAAFVASHLPSDEADVLFGPPGVAPSSPSDPSFAFVYILRRDSADECDWETDFNWSGAVAEPPFVQAHIERKNAKPESYCGNYTQRWLLLIHEGFKPSSGYDLSPAIGMTEFVCSYDRAFIYTLVGGRVTELQIAKASRSAV